MRWQRRGPHQDDALNLNVSLLGHGTVLPCLGLVTSGTMEVPQAAALLHLTATS